MFATSPLISIYHWSSPSSWILTLSSGFMYGHLPNHELIWCMTSQHSAADLVVNVSSTEVGQTLYIYIYMNILLAPGNVDDRDRRSLQNPVLADWNHYWGPHTLYQSSQILPISPIKKSSRTAPLFLDYLSNLAIPPPGWYSTQN